MLSILTQRSNCFPSQFACFLPWPSPALWERIFDRSECPSIAACFGCRRRPILSTLSISCLGASESKAALFLSLSLSATRANGGPNGSTGIQGSTTGEASLAWLGWLCFGTNASSAPGRNAVECTRDAQSRPTPALLAPYVQHREKRDKTTQGQNKEACGAWVRNYQHQRRPTKALRNEGTHPRCCYGNILHAQSDTMLRPNDGSNDGSSEQHDDKVQRVVRVRVYASLVSLSHGQR